MYTYFSQYMVNLVTDAISNATSSLQAKNFSIFANAWQKISHTLTAEFSKMDNEAYVALNI